MNRCLRDQAFCLEGDIMDLMKRFYKTIIIFLVLLIMTGCREKSGESEEKISFVSISESEAKKMMEEDNSLIIVDVREEYEYEEGHIIDAVCIPLGTIDESVSEILKDRDQVILVFCRSGRRSKEACQKLADLGYRRVYDFGGILDWTGEVVTD